MPSLPAARCRKTLYCSEIQVPGRQLSGHMDILDTGIGAPICVQWAGIGNHCDFHSRFP
jgi:hypothetical protein